MWIEPERCVSLLLPVSPSLKHVAATNFTMNIYLSKCIKLMRWNIKQFSCEWMLTELNWSHSCSPQCPACSHIRVVDDKLEMMYLCDSTWTTLRVRPQWERDACLILLTCTDGVYSRILLGWFLFRLLQCRSRVCTGCLILKMTQMLHAASLHPGGIPNLSPHCCRTVWQSSPTPADSDAWFTLSDSKVWQNLHEEPQWDFSKLISCCLIWCSTHIWAVLLTISPRYKEHYVNGLAFL